MQEIVYKKPSLPTGEKQCAKLLFGYNERRYCLVALMHCKKSTGNNVDLYAQYITIVQKSENIKMNAQGGQLADNGFLLG